MSTYQRDEERPRPIRPIRNAPVSETFANARLMFTASDRVVKGKPRKRLKPPGVFLNETDRQIVELIISFGWLSRFQLADYFGLSAVTVHRRCHKLSALGLLDDRSRGVSSEILYCPTRKGMRLVGMAEFKISHPTPQTLNHTAGLFAAALRFGESPKRHGIVVSEREIESAASTNKLSPRVLRQAPWAQQHFEGKFGTWKPAATPVHGGSGTGHKRPDLLLIKEGVSPTPVELELSQKSKISDYVRIFESYDRAIKAGDMASPVIYVTAEVAGNVHAISTALKTALGQANLYHRMTVEFLVFEISAAHWLPRSAVNGWWRKASRAA